MSARQSHPSVKLDHEKCRRNARHNDTREDQHRQNCSDRHRLWPRAHLEEAVADAEESQDRQRDDNADTDDAHCEKCSEEASRQGFFRIDLDRLVAARTGTRKMGGNDVILAEPTSAVRAGILRPANDRHQAPRPGRLCYPSPAQSFGYRRGVLGQVEGPSFQLPGVQAVALFQEPFASHRENVA